MARSCEYGNKLVRLFFFDRVHLVVLIMTIILSIKKSSNTTFTMYLITIDI